MLTCQIERDLAVTVLRLDGPLRLSTVGQIRSTLTKCLAECPYAIVVDLSRVTVELPITLTVFGAVTRRSPEWQQVPLILVSNDPAVELAGHAWHIAVCGSEADARALVVAGSLPVTHRVSRTLRPATMATESARRMVAEACSAWAIARLALPGELIMTELVSNAVQHARTDLQAGAMFRRGLLHLTVADGSPTPPRMVPELPSPMAAGGRGLLLVNEFSTAWGYSPAGGGKVVWATLRP